MVEAAARNGSGGTLNTFSAYITESTNHLVIVPHAKRLAIEDAVWRLDQCDLAFGRAAGETGTVPDTG